IRIELRSQGTLVIAVHAGYIDTDMVATINAPKTSPEEVAAHIIEGIRNNQEEVLADQTSQEVKAVFASNPQVLYQRFQAELGNEVAGVVVRVGSRVQRFKPGDEVYARPDDDRIGAFAEFIAIQEDAVAKKPKNLTMEEAASIPLVGLTAWQVLVERAKLSTG